MKVGIIGLVAAAALALAACNDKQVIESKNITIVGAGSTFVAPLMSKWAEVYKKEEGVTINYQAIGSGGGIKQIREGTVNFAATDMPLKDNELVEANIVQVPVIKGEIVLAVNTPFDVKLTPQQVADIFEGRVSNWKELGYADLPIIPIVRSDGSGTTYTVADYLKNNSTWSSGVGSQINWKTDKAVGAKGNAGVAAAVTKVAGSIGYVEHSYAKSNGIKTAKLNGNPIIGTTYILLKSGEKLNSEIISFLYWAITVGSGEARALDYIPITSVEYTKFENALKDLEKK